METKVKFSWWQWITLKPFRQRRAVIYLDEAEFDTVRQLLVDLFAPFIEKIQNLDIEPKKASIVVKAYRNILMSFALAIAHPEVNYLADDGFENLLLLMLEDITATLGNQKPNFQEKVRNLSEDIVKIIYINKTDKAFAPDDKVFFKNITIGQTRVELQTLNTDKDVEPSEENVQDPKTEAVKKADEFQAMADKTSKEALAGLSRSKRKGKQSS